MASKNPEIGTIKCDSCGGTSTVHKTSRGKGVYLYTRCDSCGLDQRNGSAVQTRLWNGTHWHEGMKPESAPPNIKNDDWQPSDKPDQSSVDDAKGKKDKPVNQTKKTGSIAGLSLVAGALVVGAIGVLALKKKPVKKQQANYVPAGANYEPIN